MAQTRSTTQSKKRTKKDPIPPPTKETIVAMNTPESCGDAENSVATEAVTKVVTEVVADITTEAVTEAVAEAVTEVVAEATTGVATEAVTKPVAEDATEESPLAGVVVTHPSSPTVPESTSYVRTDRKVSLVIPVYNEAGHLERFLQMIDALVLPIPKELVIIDDCSRDHSREILREFPFQSDVQLIEQPTNQGKGAAVREGITRATGDFIGVQDADFEYAPWELPQLLMPLVQERADVVFGSRFRENAQVHRTYHYLINRFLTMLSNLSSGLYLTDMETCYKFFRADVIKNLVLESDRFGFEPEVTAKIARLKLRVLELPISYYPRNYMEGKKITWRDGVAALRHILFYNFFREDKDCFRQELPNRYRVKGQHWL